MREKILRWSKGNIEIMPGSPVERVRELLIDIDHRLNDTSTMSEYTSIILYCIWHDATKYIENIGSGE